jgi:predicted RNA-binding protein YlxR (DUF448 family)
MLRFVRGPDQQVLPDLAARLPGRGMWLSADRNVLNKALASKAFARAAKAPVRVDPDLVACVERLLVRRVIDTLGLARRAADLVLGYEQVRACLRSGAAALLIEAADGAADGRDKLRRLAPGLPVVAVLTRAELGAAVGRAEVVHAALGPGRLAERMLCDMARLSGFRPLAPSESVAQRTTMKSEGTSGPR